MTETERDLLELCASTCTWYRSCGGGGDWPKPEHCTRHERLAAEYRKELH